MPTTSYEGAAPASPTPRVLVGARVKSASDGDSAQHARVRGQFGHFDFDFVHDQHSSQEDVFYTTVRPLVHKLLEGSSSAVLLYGASKTGKTYTLEGVGAVGGYKEGLIPRAVAVMHHLIETSQHKGTLVVTQSALTTSATAQLLDLQCPGSAPRKISQTLDQASPSQPTLHQYCIRHPNDIFQVLGSGKLVGSLGSPPSCSPSSHHWKGWSLPTGPGTAHVMLTLAFTRACCTQKGLPETAKLHFVELAAPPAKQMLPSTSSKAKASLAQAQALFKSYNSLTTVLLALKQQRRKHEPSVHIPWRECHLTRWLHEALSNSSHVVLMGTVAAGAAAANDTLATLNWLSRFRAEGGSLTGAVWTSPHGAVEGSPHCHERRWPAGYMQWREYELRRLQQEGLDVSNQAAPPPLQGPPVDPQEGQQHECTPLHEEPEETEQDKAHKELKAARKALKSSLRALSTAEADRVTLQRQVNKLSGSLQVQVAALNQEAARIRAHHEAGSAAKHKEHEQQMHHLQQQLQLAQQEHRNLQARLEASKQAAAAREAEAAAAAAAEQAAKRAAAELKKQKQAAAAAAAVAGAQPHRSCPGVQLPQQSPQQFLQQQPVQLMQQAPVHAVQQYAGQQMHHQQPVQHLQPLTRQAEARLEMQGQQMLSRAANAQRSQSPVHSAVPTAAPNAFAGLSSSGMSFSPGCYSMQSPDYAACVLDMQQHVHTLKGSLARHRHHHRGHSPSHGRRDAKASDRLHTDDHNQEFSPARHNRSHAERVDRLHMVDHDAEVSPARHRRCRAERADRVHTDSRDKEAPPVRHSHAKRHDMRHTDRRGEEVSSVRDKHSHAALQELFDSDGRSEAESELEASSTGRDSSDSSSDSDSLDGSKHQAAHRKLLQKFKQLQQHAQQAQHEHAQEAQAQHAQHDQDEQLCDRLKREVAARTQQGTETQARLDSVGKELTDCRDTLEDTRQGFASLQTHHAALKLQLERSELHSRDSAAQAQDFHTRVTDLTADRDGLASQLANLTGTDKQLKKNLKCIVRCLKASNPLHSVLHYAEELSSESADDHAGTACTALQSDLKWVMHRLSELFKEGSLAQSQAASSAADSEKLQEKLSEHLEASKASSAALQTELAAAHGKVFKSESEVQLLQQQVTQHAQQLTTLTEEKISAEQQIAELRAAENELRTVEAELREEVQELQGKLKAAQGQLQASEGHLQAEVRRLQGQMLQARGEEEEAQEQRRILKQQHNKVTNQLDEASSEVARLQSMLSAAQREVSDAETLRAGLLEQLTASRADAQALQASLDHTQHDRQKAHEMVGQVKARLAVSERELILVRQEAEGSSKSGSALGQELHAVKRQSAALQQQLNSVQAELEEGAAKHQIEVRKQQRASKHAEEEHVAAVLGLEAKLAGKQQETSNLQLINQRLFARFQSLREQLAHSQDQLTHKQLRGWLDGMLEQFDEARQHNVLHSVRRAEDRSDSLQASARRPESRSALHHEHSCTPHATEDPPYSPPIRSSSNAFADQSPLQTQKSSFARHDTPNTILSPTRTLSYSPTTPLGKQVAASAEAIRKRLLQSPASEARHAATELDLASSL